MNVELNGAKKLHVVEINMSGDTSRHPLTTISEDGTHTIAGGNSGHPPMKTTMLYVERPDGTGNGSMVRDKVAEYIIGSQTHRSELDDPEEDTKRIDFLHGLGGSTFPDSSNRDAYERTFTQSYPGGRSEFSLGIPKAYYQYYKSRPRTGDYGSYVSDRIDDSLIKDLATTFEDYGERNNQSSRQIADHAIAWVQGMKYTQDKPATGYNEYPKYPSETLVDRGGDCEDTSILMASVLEKMGYSTVLLELPSAKHMAVGVAGESDISGSYYTYKGDRYYYVETTGDGWRVGEVPDSVKQAGGNANILPVNASPSLAFKWDVTAPKSGGITVHTGTQNFGDATARTAKVQVDVEAEGGQVVAQQRKSLSNIQPKTLVNQDIQLSPPADQSLRVRIGILLNGVLHDVAKTGYHSP